MILILMICRREEHYQIFSNIRGHVITDCYNRYNAEPFKWTPSQKGIVLLRVFIARYCFQGQSLSRILF